MNLNFSLRALAAEDTSALKLEDPRSQMMMAAPTRTADAREELKTFVYAKLAVGMFCFGRAGYATRCLLTCLKKTGSASASTTGGPKRRKVSRASLHIINAVPVLKPEPSYLRSEAVRCRQRLLYQRRHAAHGSANTQNRPHSTRGSTRRPYQPKPRGKCANAHGWQN